MTQSTREFYDINDVQIEDDEQEHFDDEDQLMVSDYENFSRKYHGTQLLNDVAVMASIKKHIPSDVLEYINFLKYPKILVGNFNTKLENHHMLIKKGKLANENEINLFRYINTILQDPRCKHWYQSHFKESTQNTYANNISRYVLYIARKTKFFEPSKFIVDGSLMRNCFEELLIDKDNLNNAEGKQVQYTGIKIFKYSLQFLQYCLGFIDTIHLNEMEAARQMETKWKTIPSLDSLDLLYMQEHRKYRDSSAKEYVNKNLNDKFQQKYTDDDHYNMMINMLNKTGSGKKKDIYDGIGANLVLSIGHHYLFRASNMMILELSDTIYITQQTSNGKVPILGFRFIKGKTMNFDSSPGLVGACRNKDVVICPVMAISMSYFYQFDFNDQYGPLSGERKPDFLDKKKWYDPKVLFCDSDESRNNSPISVSKLSGLVTTCIDSVGFQSSKKGNLGRATNIERADAYGVSENQIRRQGRWHSDVLESRYSSSFAYQFIHYSAGFKPDEPYFIPRDIPVPEELQILIFPWLEEEIQKVKNRTYEKNTPLKHQDDTAIIFLRMLRDFRSIIIQDLALLVDIVPNCIYCKHSITRDPRFLAFKEQVKSAVDEHNSFNEQPNVRDGIDRVAPHIVSRLNVLHKSIEICQSNQRNSANSLTLSLQNFEDQLPGRVSETLNDMLAQYSASMLKIQRDSVMSVERLVKENIKAFQSNYAHSMVQMFSTQLRNMDNFANFANFANLEGPPKKKSKREPPSHLQGPEYRLSEVLESVQSVWDEWYIGTNSIEKRNELHNTDWRCDQERLYKHRVKIINFISLMEKKMNIDSEKAIQLLESYRKINNTDMRALSRELSSTQTKSKALQAMKAMAKFG